MGMKEHSTFPKSPELEPHHRTQFSGLYPTVEHTVGVLSDQPTGLCVCVCMCVSISVCMHVYVYLCVCVFLIGNNANYIYKYIYIHIYTLKWIGPQRHLFLSYLFFSTYFWHFMTSLGIEIVCSSVPFNLYNHDCFDLIVVLFNSRIIYIYIYIIFRKHSWKGHIHF